MANYYQVVVAFDDVNDIGTILTFLNPYAQDEWLIAQLSRYESSVLINYDKTKEYNEIEEKLKNKTEEIYNIAGLLKIK